MSAIRNKESARAIIADGGTTSSSLRFDNFAWLVIEVPAGDHATAVIVDIKSGDGSSWIEAFTVDDVANRIKPLTAIELATIGPFREFRLRVAGAVTGEKVYYCHMSN